MAIPKGFRNILGIATSVYALARNDSGYCKYYSVPFSRSAWTLVGRPHRLMKPSACFWS